MRILVLGGTIFVGKYIVEAALAGGAAVTIFHRGRHPASFSGPVEEVLGDRDSDLADLRRQTWDLAIDVSGYTPRIVRQSAQALKGVVEHYTFISSVSVYADEHAEGRDESARLLPPEYGTEKVDGDTYGPLKVACEETVHEVYGERALVVRPCLVGGPDDPTDRLTYWPRSVHQAAAGSGRFLAPGDLAGPVQFIDVRDLAAWIVRMSRDRRPGTFNAAAAPMTMAGLVAASLEATRSTAEPVWVDEAFLLAAGIRPSVDIPLWLDYPHRGFATFSSARAVAAGLVPRRPAETLLDVWNWDRRRGLPPLKVGLTADRQAEILAAWDALSARQARGR